MRTIRISLVTGLAAAFVVASMGCQPRAPQTRAQSARRIGVTHVVLVWLKQPGDLAGRQSLIYASKQLATIPGVVDVQAGPPLPSTRPVVDASFDVGITVTFTDPEALEEYAAHPTHLKLANEVLKPLTDHYKVYDFVVNDPGSPTK